MLDLLLLVAFSVFVAVTMALVLQDIGRRDAK
jgi:hypothetical protein